MADPLAQRFVFVVGRSKRLRFTATLEGGGPFTLPATTTFSIRDVTADVRLVKTVGDGVLLEDPATACVVTLTSADTAQLDGKAVAWDLWTNNPGGDADDPLAGGTATGKALGL